jgi:hypothetical protein
VEANLMVLAPAVGSRGLSGRRCVVRTPTHLTRLFAPYSLVRGRRWLLCQKLTRVGRVPVGQPWNVTGRKSLMRRGRCSPDEEVLIGGLTRRRIASAMARQATLRRTCTSTASPPRGVAAILRHHAVIQPAAVNRARVRHVP